jgi:predicted transglutaminase-like cysteine proteinase
MQRRLLIRASVALWPLPPGSRAAAAADAGHERLQRWQRLVEQAADASAAARIEIVNVALNRLIEERIDPDRSTWPTPGEAIARGAGDCRTFAVLKFFALLAAGHDAADVRVLYTIQQRRATPGLQQPHLVAWARSAVDAEALVLDNQNPFTLPLAQRPDLRPVFSLDCEHLRRGASDEVDRPARALRPWRALLERGAGGRGAQSLVWISTTRPLRGLTSQR